MMKIKCFSRNKHDNPSVLTAFQEKHAELLKGFFIKQNFIIIIEIQTQLKSFVFLFQMLRYIFILYFRSEVFSDKTDDIKILNKS